MDPKPSGRLSKYPHTRKAQSFQQSNVNVLHDRTARPQWWYKCVLQVQRKRWLQFIIIPGCISINII